MARRAFKQGDWVVFRRSKYTTHPGRRAQEVQAAERGEYYSYFVDKFWVVADVLPDGTLLLKTRRGKKHLIDANDPQLRHASLWERIRYRTRFGQPRTSDAGTES